MAKMNEPGTGYGKKGETGEKMPKGAAKADTSGERHTGIKNGVGMGKADATGRSGNGGHDYGEYNTGREEKTCYTHTRVPHEQDK